MASTPTGQLLAFVKGLLGSWKYSDLTITCGDDGHKVHKTVVCTRCGFFERAESFAVGREAAESKIDLPEDDPAIIELLLQFLYEGEYEPTLQSSSVNPPTQLQNWDLHTCVSHVAGRRRKCARIECEKQLCGHHRCGRDCHSDCHFFTCEPCTEALLTADQPPNGHVQLLVHAKMYEIADKYDVPGLKELSRDKFDKACGAFWTCEQFGIAAEYVYTTTPDEDEGLRKCVRDTLAAHHEIMKRASIEIFLQKRPELMYELLTGAQ